MSEKKPAQNKHMSTTTKVLIGVGAVAVVAVSAVLWAAAVVDNTEVEKDYITPEELAQQTQQDKLDAAVSQLKASANLYLAENGRYPDGLEDFVTSPETVKENIPGLSYILNDDGSVTIKYTNTNGEQDKVVLPAPDKD